MDLETVILNFAMGAKRAQMVLNAENLKDAQAIQDGLVDTRTGGGGAGSSLIPHVPLAIKEVSFAYELKCSMNFSQDLTLKINWNVSLSTETHVEFTEDKTLNLSITFQNIMSLTAEANG